MVFGGFRYTICQQHRRYGDKIKPTRLHDLGVGSVILFGSRLAGAFVLDTVLVVASSSPHNQSTYRRLSQAPSYFEVTLNTLYAQDSNHGCCDPSAPGDTYRLYEGATSDHPIDGMFSFVPCLPYRPQQSAFARPVIQHPALSSNQSQGFRVPIVGDTSRIRAVWEDIRQEVLTDPSGLWLGTSLRFPANRTAARGSETEALAQEVRQGS